MTEGLISRDEHVTPSTSPPTPLFLHTGCQGSPFLIIEDGSGGKPAVAIQCNRLGHFSNENSMSRRYGYRVKPRDVVYEMVLSSKNEKITRNKNMKKKRCSASATWLQRQRSYAETSLPPDYEKQRGVGTDSGSSAPTSLFPVQNSHS